MFENVIVGVDGKDGGRDAIALARLLHDRDGELTLAYVYHGDRHLRHGSGPPHEAAERAGGLLEAERERAGVHAQICSRESSSVGRGLHELAEAIEADLLVIGSCRRGRLGRVMIADDTRDALNGAPCTVAVAPAGYADQPVTMREIGVGYDGSPESEHALAFARDFAARHHAKLSAFEAVGVPSYPFYGGPEIGDVINDMVDAARDRVAGLGDVEPHAAFGQAGEELALFGASVDLLVIGSRSYGALGRLVHGSTAQKLARYPRCPLLVLTRGARSRDSVESTLADAEPIAATDGARPARRTPPDA
jgi:nucleotide-binding universal stress UspA family protein